MSEYNKYGEKVEVIVGWGCGPDIMVKVSHVNDLHEVGIRYFDLDVASAKQLAVLLYNQASEVELLEREAAKHLAKLAPPHAGFSDITGGEHD